MIFNKIPIFKIDFSNIKIKLKENFDKFEKIIYVQNNKFNLKIIDNFKIEVKNLSLKVLIGTGNAANTAVLVGIVSGLFSIIIRKFLKQNGNNYWDVIPVYENNNMLKIELNCIISLKLIHIIYTIFNLNKEEDKKNGRTSNTRHYVYSHE